MLDQGFPRELAERVHIPSHERANPFKSAPKVENSEKVTIDVELLKELYKSASKEQKEQLDSSYPNHFETYYNFGHEYKVAVSEYSGPLMIAQGLAPAGFERKCLVVSHCYEMRTVKQNGFTFISFVKK